MRLTDRQHCRLHLLRALRRAEPVSRTQLAVLTGYSTQLVSDLVAELRERELIAEAPSSAIGRGRPRRMLQISGQGTAMLGAFLYPDHRLGIELVDLRGNRLSSTTVCLPVTRTVQGLVPYLENAIREGVASSTFPINSIRAVGVGVPGTVDSARGILHHMPRYGAEAVPLASMLSQRLGLPVYLDSAADVLARADYWFGDERLVDDFAMIFVGFGLSYAHYVDGRLRAGSHGLNPEIAHLKFWLGATDPCHCGGRGCLGMYASVGGLVTRLAAARGLARPDLSEMSALLQCLANEVQQGVPDAVDAFDTAGRMLGMAAANFVMLEDPARLVVNVQDPVFCSLIKDRICDAFQGNLHPAFRGRAELEVRASEEIAFAKGAAALALESIYRGENA